MNEITINLDLELDLESKQKCTSTDLAQRVIDALVGMQQSFGSNDDSFNENRPYCGAHVDLDKPDDLTFTEVDDYEERAQPSRADRVRFSDVLSEGNQAALTVFNNLKEKLSDTFATEVESVEVEVSNPLPDNKHAIMVPQKEPVTENTYAVRELDILRKKAKMLENYTATVKVDTQQVHHENPIKVWAYALDRVCESMAYGRPLTTS